MISFEEVYKEVEKSSHETAFNRGECEALYQLSLATTDGANIVEIGVQYGRSTTVLGMVAKEKHLSWVYAVDNWSEPESPEAKAHVEEFIKWLNLPVKIWSMSSVEAERKWLNEMDIHLLHIDGDHTYKGVFEDCELWMPKVKVGGFACFDDYREHIHPEVVKAVNDYIAKANTQFDYVQWEFVRLAGEKLAIFRRVK